MRSCPILAALLALLLSGTAVAQMATEVAPRSYRTGAPAASVQLPTFSFFSTGTTVLVPDRGSVSMGGVNRAASGRTSMGVPLSPLRNSSFGTTSGASNVSVGVWIHDMEAMDQAVLSQSSTYARYLQSRNAAGRSSTAVADGARGNPAWQAGAAPGAVLGDVEQERARRDAQLAARSSEAADFFQRGARAEADGKTGVAKIYYQMAARRATGPLKDQVLARLEAMLAGDQSAQMAASNP